MADSTREESPRLGRWTLDVGRRRLAVDNQSVAVGERAFDLLVALADAPGTVVSTDSLLQQVWPSRVVEENNLHVHVSALRSLLGAEAIRTVRGRGYLLTLPLSAVAAEVAVSVATPPAQTPGGAPPDAAVEGAHLGAGNLPQHMQALIGRETDMRRLQQLLHEHRTVTMTGPGGVGKTSLALAAVQDLASGAWLVELAGAAEHTPLAEAVARSLGITLPGLHEADEELVDVLRTRPLLLVLDNCEHRAHEASHLVDRLTRGTASVRVLATSQVPLQHRGEQIFRLSPLALPRSDAPAEEACAASAVALFRARLAGHDVALCVNNADGGDDSLADVVAICQGLDGLPLAIELAAARVPLLGLKGLRQRLGQQLTLLSGGPRDAPARQQTLQAAIEWSHALLSDEERRAFRRLSIFVGGFSVVVAQQVLDMPADDEAPALHMLDTLRDKSLLASPVGRTADAAMPRLRLLESTRAFALAQLQASGEHAATALRLARAMLLLHQRDDGPRNFDAKVDDAPPIAADLDNLRASLDWVATQPDQPLLHIELAGAAAWIWSRLGLRAEGLRRCRQALARVGEQTPPRIEARLQLGWAALVHRRGEEGDSVAAARAAALYEGLGDRMGRFRALSILAFMQALAGDDDASVATLEALADAFDPAWGSLQWGAYNWTVAACLAQFGRFDEAMAIRNRSLRPVEMTGGDGAQAIAWTSSAQLASCIEDFDTAVKHAQRGLAAARRGRARGRLGMVLGDLACYLSEQGRVDEALPIAAEAMGLRALDGTLGMMLDQLARLACARGRYSEAAMALGRAAVHHLQRKGLRERYLQGPHQRATAAAAAAMSPAEAQELYTLGAAMGDDEVARLTLRD